MAENQDYRLVIGKVPNNGDPLGTGGTRRPGGTLSSQVRDLREVGDDALARLDAPVSSTSPSFAKELGRQLLFNIADQLAREVVIPGSKKVWNERVAPAIGQKWKTWRAKQVPSDESDSVEVSEGEWVDVDWSEPAAEIEAIDRPTIVLSRQEAQWRIAEARRAARELAQHLAVLRASGVVDDLDVLSLLVGDGALEMTATASSKAGQDLVEDADLKPEPTRISQRPIHTENSYSPWRRVPTEDDEDGHSSAPQ
ncbi:hypothetical protein [Herbiconiux flava]|uniref:Uncharacterized protein n=1 Tax=Herbiconiux flava TaxID=881268 RepID=A0A852SNY5_9MICO|nr:hypothetical protein [Herbiconiux flava]NYD70568.1 hypothetical protein [Herbiconiux flava]GLK17324.1 hypothetical protein GCM10017602_18060 [Herbiconiux flava]